LFLPTKHNCHNRLDNRFIFDNVRSAIRLNMPTWNHSAGRQLFRTCRAKIFPNIIMNSVITQFLVSAMLLCQLLGMLVHRHDENGVDLHECHSEVLENEHHHHHTNESHFHFEGLNWLLDSKQSSSDDSNAILIECDLQPLAFSQQFQFELPRFCAQYWFTLSEFSRQASIQKLSIYKFNRAARSGQEFLRLHCVFRL